MLERIYRLHSADLQIPTMWQCDVLMRPIKQPLKKVFHNLLQCNQDCCGSSLFFISWMLFFLLTFKKTTNIDFSNISVETSHFWIDTPFLRRQCDAPATSAVSLSSRGDSILQKSRLLRKILRWYLHHYFYKYMFFFRTSTKVVMTCRNCYSASYFLDFL